MKKLIACFALAAAAITTGCNQQNPGGPGVTQSTNPSGTSTTANKPMYGEAPGTFVVNVPTLATSLKQGETKTATISLSRGKDFDEDVSITLSDLPNGVTADPVAPVIKHGDKDLKLTFHAADDAAIGEFTVKLMGHPTKGPDATSDMKLSITAK